MTLPSSLLSIWAYFQNRIHPSSTYFFLIFCLRVRNLILIDYFLELFPHQISLRGLQLVEWEAIKNLFFWRWMQMSWRVYQFMKYDRKHYFNKSGHIEDQTRVTLRVLKQLIGGRKQLFRGLALLCCSYVIKRIWINHIIQ